MADSDFTPYGVIYLITNKKTGKVYVGQTTMTVSERWTAHCRCDSYCVALRHAIKKHGKESFDITEIDKAYSKSDLDEKEVFYINYYDANNRVKGYNLMSGGSFGKHSDESKARMSIAVRKAYENPEFKLKLSAVRKGKKRSSEFCKKSSERMLGSTVAPEVKQKISRSVTEYWKSDEYRKLVSERQKSARSTDEYRTMVSQNTKAQWNDPEKKEKLKASLSAGKLAMWADPERKAAFLSKRNATNAAKRAISI